MPSTVSTSSAEKLKPLTSLRFFAALMIFLYHLQQYDDAPWLNAVAVPALHGVSFFFVLSGFVLTHAYGARQFSARDFYVARLARIFPTHLVALCVLVVVLPLAAARGQHLSGPMTAISLAAKLTMLDSWVPIRGVLQSWNNVSWSISTEAAFYAAFPWLLVAVRWNAAVTLALAAVAAAAVPAFGEAIGLSLQSADRLTPTLANLGSYNPLARGFEFVLGMTAHGVWRRRVAPGALSGAGWTLAEAGVFVALATWLIVAVPFLDARSRGPLHVWFHVAGSCWAFALALPILAGGRGAIARALSRRPLVRLGEISFAFYMFHMIALRACSLYIGPGSPAILTFGLSIALAAASHVWLEGAARRRIVDFFGRYPGAGLERAYRPATQGSKAACCERLSGGGSPSSRGAGLRRMSDGCRQITARAEIS